MTVRILASKEEAVQASKEAREDFLTRLKRNDYSTPMESIKKWWPLATEA